MPSVEPGRPGPGRGVGHCLEGTSPTRLPECFARVPSPAVPPQHPACFVTVSEGQRPDTGLALVTQHRRRPQAVCATPGALHKGRSRQGSPRGKGVRRGAVGASHPSLKPAAGQTGAGPPRVHMRVQCGAASVCVCAGARSAVRAACSPGCLRSSDTERKRGLE